MKPGDTVRCTFPPEPVVVDAGKTVDVTILRERTDPCYAEYPFVVAWKTYSRPVKLEWLESAARSTKQPMRRRSTP